MGQAGSLLLARRGLHVYGRGPHAAALTTVSRRRDCGRNSGRRRKKMSPGTDEFQPLRRFYPLEGQAKQHEHRSYRGKPE
jgi:hypothetical protein